jgi:hypothetical protein
MINPQVRSWRASQHRLRGLDGVHLSRGVLEYGQQGQRQAFPNAERQSFFPIQEEDIATRGKLDGLPGEAAGGDADGVSGLLSAHRPVELIDGRSPHPTAREQFALDVHLAPATVSYHVDSTIAAGPGGLGLVAKLLDQQTNLLLK